MPKLCSQDHHRLLQEDEDTANQGSQYKLLFNVQENSERSAQPLHTKHQKVRSKEGEGVLTGMEYKEHKDTVSSTINSYQSTKVKNHQTKH